MALKTPKEEALDFTSSSTCSSRVLCTAASVVKWDVGSCRARRCWKLQGTQCSRTNSTAATARRRHRHLQGAPGLLHVMTGASPAALICESKGGGQKGLDHSYTARVIFAFFALRCRSLLGRAGLYQMRLGVAVAVGLGLQSFGAGNGQENKLKRGNCRFGPSMSLRVGIWDRGGMRRRTG